MFGEPAARDLISALAIASNKEAAPGWDGWLPGNLKTFAKKSQASLGSESESALHHVSEVLSKGTFSGRIDERINVIDHYKDYLLDLDDPEEVFRRIAKAQNNLRMARAFMLAPFTVPRVWNGTVFLSWDGKTTSFPIL